jgi:hypothetical protein
MWTKRQKSWLNIELTLLFQELRNDGLNVGTNSLFTRLTPCATTNTAVYDATIPTGYNIIGASVGHEKTSVIANNLPNIRYVLDNNILRSKIDRSLVSVYANVKITLP